MLTWVSALYVITASPRHSWPLNPLISHQSNVHEELCLENCIYECFTVFCLFKDIFVLWLLMKSLPISCNNICGTWSMLVGSLNWKCKKHLSLLSCKIIFAFMEIVFLSVSMLLLMQLCFLSFHTGLWCWVCFVNTVYSEPSVLCLCNVSSVVTINETTGRSDRIYFAE